MDLAAREIVKQPGIDGAGQQFTFFGTGSQFGLLIQEPFEFGARKIRVQHQTGFGTKERFVTQSLEFGTDLCRAAALPDDGIVNGQTRGFFPEHQGLTLVGHTHRSNLTGRDATA